MFHVKHNNTWNILKKGAVALAIFNRKCDGPFLVEKVVNYACFGG